MRHRTGLPAWARPFQSYGSSRAAPLFRSINGPRTLRSTGKCARGFLLRPVASWEKKHCGSRKAARSGVERSVQSTCWLVHWECRVVAHCCAQRTLEYKSTRLVTMCRTPFADEGDSLSQRIEAFLSVIDVCVWMRVSTQR